MGAIGTPLTPHVRKAPVKKQAAATNHGHHCYDSMSTQLLPLLALSKVYVTDLDVEGVIPLDTLLGSGKRVLFKFAIGWWIMIDCAARHPSSAELNHAYHTIGVISTLSLIMVNVVSNAQVRGERVFTNGVCGPAGARVWLFIGFVLGFAALLGSSWILVATNFYSTSLSVFLQNAFIFASSMAFKFGRKESDSWGS